MNINKKIIYRIENKYKDIIIDDEILRYNIKIIKKELRKVSYYINKLIKNKKQIYKYNYEIYRLINTEDNIKYIIYIINKENENIEKEINRYIIDKNIVKIISKYIN